MLPGPLTELEVWTGAVAASGRFGFACTVGVGVGCTGGFGWIDAAGLTEEAGWTREDEDLALTLSLPTWLAEDELVWDDVSQCYEVSLL
jgi:NhaP-type Na+/H+ or K+/H+ antiporter